MEKHHFEFRYKKHFKKQSYFQTDMERKEK